MSLLHVLLYGLKSLFRSFHGRPVTRPPVVLYFQDVFAYLVSIILPNGAVEFLAILVYYQEAICS
jgi:hypothetical protein